MKLWDWLLGRRLATREEEHQRIGVLAGIPMLGLDALGSAAYGPEAALTLLIPLGLAGVWYIGPITGLIVVLLLVVYFSYRQTISAYPTGGGSYTVAKENLGTSWGLLAAAALMLDYVLVVAIGISAGVGALVSAVPMLKGWTLSLCLVLLVLITLVNLRGVRESGAAFMLPTYLFIVSMLGVLAYGIVKTLLADGHPVADEAVPKLPDATQAAGPWILLRAFASGCTALTGVEAVSNGVSAFSKPCVKYAQRTLTSIIALLALMLLGIAYLCQAYGIGATNPEDEKKYQSILSQLVAAVAGRGVVYYVTIGSVLAVLALSANTGFADFPRLCRVIAQDDFLPRVFAHRGRRLVYSHGIMVLAVLAGALLIAFGGITDHLIPLFAIGAFLAFTLSQAGMVEHWRRVRRPAAEPAGDAPHTPVDPSGALRSMVINGLGALCTGVALVVVLVSKFIDGAWLTVVLIPGFLLLFYGVRRHYRMVAREVATQAPLDVLQLHPPLVLLLVRDWNVITRKALRFAMKISPDVHALHIAADEAEAVDVREKWALRVVYPTVEAGLPTPKLVVIPSPYRQIHAPLTAFLKQLEKEHPHRTLAVIIPELVERRWYHYLMHNKTAAVLKAYLYFSGLQRVVVINVPWYLSC
jgi:amino acid transporter